MGKHNILINFVQRIDKMQCRFTITGNIMISMQNQKILRPDMQSPTFMRKYHCHVHSQVSNTENSITRA